MSSFAVGDRVELKGIVGGGHRGTIVKIGRPPVFLFQKAYFVELDGTALGHSMLRVKKFNLRRLDESSENEQRCPYCAETIKSAAIKCKHCGSDLGGDRAQGL